MAIQKNKVVNPLQLITFLAISELFYGGELWEKGTQLVKSGMCTNTEDKAIDADADIKALAANALYYQQNSYGKLQMVARTEAGQVAYISLMHDKDGDAVIDENDTYDVFECSAKREFRFDADGTEVVIAKGHKILKAFTAS